MTRKNSREKHLTTAQMYDEYLKLSEIGRYEDAIKKLVLATQLNEPNAISALAYEYYNNFPEKMDESIALYRKAVRLGDPLSAINLARHYERIGNARWYLFWLKKAIDMGIDEAADELLAPFPYLLQTGRDLFDRGDFEEARKIYKLAARHGNIEAGRELQGRGRTS